MRRYLSVVALGILSLVASSLASAQAAKWVEGKHYYLVTPAQAQKVPAGKVEVLEVFSYGCPACNQILGFMKKLKAALPANAQIAYLHAAFNPTENWPLFQRAFITAESLGIAERAHDSFFDAVWKPNGELSITEGGGRLKRNLPKIEDAAKFYASRTGVKPETFIATAKSFSVEGKIKQAEKQIVAMHVDRTPTFVVAGKYRLHFESAGGADQAIELINFLVAKEAAAKR